MRAPLLADNALPSFGRDFTALLPARDIPLALETDAVRRYNLLARSAALPTARMPA